MPAFLYEFLTSDGFYYFLFVWVLICIASAAKRNILLEKLKNLTSKPVIFDEDKSEPVDFYPRTAFERIAKAIVDFLEKPFISIIDGLGKWINGLKSLVTDSEKKWLPFGYSLFFLLLVFFIFADAIAIANTLVFYGLLDVADLWEPLTRYEFATAGGSLFAILVAGLITSEIYSTKSQFTEWDKIEGTWKDIAKAFTRILIISGFVVVFFLGMQRLISLGYFTNFGSTVRSGVDFVVTILIPLNTVLATALILIEGYKGLALVIILFLAIVLATVHILDYLSPLIRYVLPFTIDVVYRLILMAAFIIGFFIITPIDLVISTVTAPFRPK